MKAKERKFVAEYLKDQNATQAAIRAGYSKRSAGQWGHVLLKKHEIAEFVEAALRKAEKDAIISVTYVLEGLKEVAERCMERVPVMERSPSDGRKFIQKENEDGEGVWEFDSAGANKAFELLGKHLKMFTDKIEVHASDDLMNALQAARKRRDNAPK